MLSVFCTQLNHEFKDLLNELYELGFRFTLTGGIVRDLFMTNNLGHDFDIELSFEKDLFLDEWKTKRDELYQYLVAKGLNPQVAPKFGVIKFDFKHYNVELAPARKEFYELNQTKSFDHSNFDITFLTSRDLKVNFQRRDFTMNAIGIHLDFENNKLKASLEDPFNGVNSIKNNELHICGDNFSLDPVRFARAIRFRNKYEMIYSSKLSSLLLKMDLTGLSSYYFFYEAFKASFFKFTKEFFEIVEVNSIPLNPTISLLSFLGKISNEDTILTHKDVLHVLVKNKIEKEKLELYRSTAGIKKSVLADVAKNAY